MLDNLFSMQGKVCVVTGGSRGLGAFMAQGFLEAGAKRVYITARKAEACLAAAEELSQFGECVALVGDVATSEGLWHSLSSSTSVNSILMCWSIMPVRHGARHLGSFQKRVGQSHGLKREKPILLTQALTPLLEKNATKDNTSAVINIGSIAGIVGNGLDNYSYAVSKSAIHQLTRVLAKELVDKHIRVNAIAPGRFYSKMTEFLSEDKDAFEEELQSIPMRRWGESTDIAGVALMLASKAGAFMTGQILPVDGGTTLVN
ncbi:SDR family oxidoreductase [Paraglaciecola sp. Hal342]